jgi:hypothetical protein
MADAPVFTAIHTGTERDDGVLTTGLADADGGYLTFQLAPLPFDQQDIDLGMDTYHLELNGQEASGYGGVARCTLRAGLLTLDLTDKGAANLERRQVTVALDLDADAMADLRTTLRTVFTYGNPAHHPVLDLD